MTRLATLALLGWIALAPAAMAQEEAEVPNRAAAAEAYDRGSAFYLNEDFVRAAQWFETAYRLAPAAPTLMQAIRAHVRAGHAIRAANLALRLRGLHGDDAEAAHMADEILAEHAPQLFRLDLECADCTLEIDGRVWSYTSAMLEPMTEHQVVVSRGEARRELTVRGERGERRTIAAPDEEPEAREVEPAETTEPSTPPPSTPPPRSSMPLPPWVFGIGVGLTVASAGVLIWSGVDTLAGVDAFNAMPTWDAFYEGEAKETRTNVLIGVTIGLGALTVLTAILTDWGGPSAPSVSLVVDPTQLGLSYRDRF